ncbi:hypothetical protein BN903_137 [Halorubrum sp. AJ67]|nr:hypothetical protein BN903_137 [Halorubrum sp. AJ67]
MTGSDPVSLPYHVECSSDGLALTSNDMGSMAHTPYRVKTGPIKLDEANSSTPTPTPDTE